MRSSSYRTWLLAAALAVLAWVMLFRGLGSFGLVGPDEPRYAEIAAEMLTSGDSITPRLLGIAWFEKPALFYWMAAAAYRVGGIGAASARAANAVAALLLIVALALFVRRLRGATAAWLTALLALTSMFIFGFARAASTDMPLTATLVISELCLYNWIAGRYRREPSEAWLHLAAIVLGFAILAKGPVAIVLEALALLAFAAIMRHWEWLAGLFSPLALALFFAVAAPWYIAVDARHPSFFHTFFLEHNIERFTTNLFRHPEPFWYYAPILALSIFPWSGLLALPVIDCLHGGAGWGRRRTAQSPAAGEAPADKAVAPPQSPPAGAPAVDRERWPGPKLYLACCTLAPVVFFSLSHSKLPGYILPSVPPLVALIALCACDLGLAASDWARFPRWPLLVCGALAALVPPLLPLLRWTFAAGPRPSTAAMLRGAPVMWVLAAFLLADFILLLAYRRLAVVAAVVILIVAAGVVWLTGPFAPVIDASSSARPLALALERVCGPGVLRPLPIEPRADAAMDAAADAQANAQIIAQATAPVAALAPAPPAVSLPGEPAGDYTCGGLPVFGWNAGRALDYGLGFYLHRHLPDLPGAPNAAATWPRAAIVVLDRRDLPRFAAILSRGFATSPAAIAAPLPGVDLAAIPWTIVRYAAR
jgi:4-amino-4-deoxy-L-arabinose transferase-like glycosyltransferase